MRLENFNIYNQDSFLTGTREVTQNTNTLQFTGNIGRNQLIIKRSDNATETGLAFRNSDDFYEASIYMESNANSGLAIATGNSNINIDSVTPSVVFNNDNTTSFNKEINIYETAPNVGAVNASLYTTGSGNDGALDINRNGALSHRLNGVGNSVLNEQGENYDLRVETNNNENTLFIDGGNDRIGIGTNAPTKDLDVNGELRVRNLPEVSGTSFLKSDNTGNISKESIFYLSDIIVAEATNRVDYTDASDNSYIVDNLDLGLSNTVVIPANQEARIIVQYSVPAGVEVGENNLARSSYMGIKFLKDDGGGSVQADNGSRKVTLPSLTNQRSNISKMTTISATYIETFTPFATPRTITFTLNGYIETAESIQHTFIFNRYSAAVGDPNFNWGNATLSTQVYVK